MAVERQKEFVRQENRREVQQQLSEPDVDPMKVLSKTAVRTVRIFAMLKDRCDRQLPQLYTAWVSKYAANIGFIDRVSNKVKKIVRNNSKEVLAQDEIWSKILATLFKMKFHPALRNKKYCKTYINRKIVEFVRAILPVVSFRKILIEVSKNAKNLQLKAVKVLLHDVLSDKS